MYLTLDMNVPCLMDALHIFGHCPDMRRRIEVAIIPKNCLRYNQCSDICYNIGKWRSLQKIIIRINGNDFSCQTMVSLYLQWKKKVPPTVQQLDLQQLQILSMDLLSLVSSGTSSCSAGSSRNLPDWNLIFIRKLQFQLLRLSSIKVIVQLGFLGPVIAYRHHREGLWTAHLLAKAERNGEEQLPFWWTRCNHILPII